MPLGKKKKKSASSVLSARHVTRPDIGLWLIALAGMIFVMAVIGAATRLTESGLSIAYWKPVSGVIPPITEQDWLREFAIYKTSPEYMKVNQGMTLANFQNIFWWEYVHRLWGRLIGFAFLIPFIFFLFKKRFDKSSILGLSVIFALGALQGFIGWWMVKSGLNQDPHVAPYRLMIHLGMAVLLMGALFWLGLSQFKAKRHFKNGYDVDFKRSFGLLALVFTTMMAGALVAGNDAGLVYNTFPLMNGHFVPDAYFSLKPWYINIFREPSTVQFHHRILALTSFLVIWGWATGEIRRPDAEITLRRRLLVRTIQSVVLWQVLLGVSTLILFVPVLLAVVHQATALFLYLLLIYHTFEVRLKQMTSTNKLTKSSVKSKPQHSYAPASGKVS